MATLSVVRDAIATTIKNAVAGLSTYPTVPESVNVPAAMVAPREADFTQAFGRGIDLHLVDVIVLVGRADDQLAQLAIDDYITGSGAKSIRAAIWNAKDLGLADTDAVVTGMTEYGATYEVGGVDYVGARLALRVLTSGTA